MVEFDEMPVGGVGSVGRGRTFEEMVEEELRREGQVSGLFVSFKNLQMFL